LKTSRNQSNRSFPRQRLDPISTAAPLKRIAGVRSDELNEVTFVTGSCDFDHGSCEESQVLKNIAQFSAQIAPGNVAQGTGTCLRTSNT
jgi:hypothetical protein